MSQTIIVGRVIIDTKDVINDFQSLIKEMENLIYQLFNKATELTEL